MLQKRYIKRDNGFSFKISKGYIHIPLIKKAAKIHTVSSYGQFVEKDHVGFLIYYTYVCTVSYRIDLSYVI